MANDKESVDSATPRDDPASDDNHTAATGHGSVPQDASTQKPPSHPQPQQAKQPKPIGWNIRDLAEVDPDRLLPGHVYRCSQVFNKEAVLELRIRSAIDLRKAGRRASRRAKRGDTPQYSTPERHSDSVKSLTDKARRWRSIASGSVAEKQAKREDAQQRATRTAALSETEQQRVSEGASNEREVEADSGALPSQSAPYDNPSSPFGAAQQQQLWQHSQEQRDAEDYHADQQQQQDDAHQQQGRCHQQVEQSQQGQPQHGQQQGRRPSPGAVNKQQQQQQQQQRRRQSPGAAEEQRTQQKQDGRREPISSAASRAAGAQRSIGKRRATGTIGPQDVIAGIGNAAAEAGDAAGDAAQQAGNAALHAGSAAADALNPRPNQDGGFDLAMGKSTLEDFGIRVYQVELLPPRVKLLVFWRVPQRIKWRTIGAALSCRSPQSVMAPVVADPHMLGYAQLYCMMLDRSKPYIRRALAVFADEDNLPCVVHCTHGKDRTGLLSALLLMLCGVSDDKIIADYERSESNLKEDRNDAVVKAGIDTTMVRDDVIASPAATMQQTLEHLRSMYGNIEGYLKAIKLSDRLKWAIRENLLRPEALQRLPHEMKRQT